MPTQGRKQAFSIQLLQLLDAALIWLAFWIASLLRAPLFEAVQWMAARFFDYPMYKDVIGGLSDITWLLFIVVPFTPLVLEMFGFYEHPLQRNFRRSIPQLLKSFTVVVLAVLLLSAAFKLPTSSRLVLGTALSISVVFLLARDGLVVRHARRKAHKGVGLENVIFAGGRDDVLELRERLAADSAAYWNVVGEFDPGSGDMEAFREMLNDEAVERVIFAVRHAGFERVSEAIEICELQGVEAWVAADFIRTQIARPTFDVLGSRPMLVLRSTPELSWSLLAKGVIDRLGALLLLILTAWMWPLVALMIKLQSPGPVLFAQQRAGRYGKPFRLLKFRSMVVDADKKLDEIKEQEGNQMSEPAFKLEQDPRVFPFGRLMRRFSIDELPQLLNVLLGDMSLVGPRPLPVYEVNAIENSAHRRRMSMKPGITCIWQVAGRNRIKDFDDWVKLDLQYIDNWSLLLDLKLLLKTIPAVLLGRGAR
jgi:exopolysaccharide biosynthesis polyprenyl glycosylphosphotransferase